MASTNPARGMRDFLPADIRKRNYVIGIIKEVYESYGFEPLETPAVENLETLTGKYGEEGNQLIFKILKRGDKLAESAKLTELTESDDSEDSPNSANSVNSLADLALRYDLTVPLARVVANNKNDLPKFFKRYQIQPVWRADRPAKGRFREFYQCDVDCIGTKSQVVEAELIKAVSEILTKLGFNDFVIRINDRRILTDILITAGVPVDKHADALIAIDKIDKIGRTGVEAEFNKRGISNESGRRLLTFLEYFLKDAPRSTFDEAQRLKLVSLIRDLDETEDFPLTLIEASNDDVENPSAISFQIEPELLPLIRKHKVELERHLMQQLGNLIRLSRVDKFINSQDVPTNTKRSYSMKYWKLLELVGLDRVKIDPILARGLSYYTGIIMEINVPDLAGSLGGGGRYDGLIGMFGKEQIPACGFSLGLERILVVMEERGMFPPEIAESTPADVMVTIWSAETVSDSLRLANELRKDGLRVTVYPEPDKLGKQMKYADSIKVPYVCVLGESEIADGTVTLKNMKSGEQETFVRSGICGKVKVA
ncbi:MAG: histidine--tRNA ligase [Pyrinomonadaceae bacterium]